jgi:hypothetical protein
VFAPGVIAPPANDAEPLPEATDAPGTAPDITGEPQQEVLPPEPRTNRISVLQADQLAPRKRGQGILRLVSNVAAAASAVSATVTRLADFRKAKTEVGATQAAGSCFAEPNRPRPVAEEQDNHAPDVHDQRPTEVEDRGTPPIEIFPPNRLPALPDVTLFPRVSNIPAVGDPGRDAFVERAQRTFVVTLRSALVDQDAEKRDAAVDYARAMGADVDAATLKQMLSTTATEFQKIILEAISALAFMRYEWEHKVRLAQRQAPNAAPDEQLEAEGQGVLEGYQQVWTFVRTHHEERPRQEEIHPREPQPEHEAPQEAPETTAQAKANYHGATYQKRPLKPEELEAMKRHWGQLLQRHEVEVKDMRGSQDGLTIDVVAQDAAKKSQLHVDNRGVEFRGEADKDDRLVKATLDYFEEHFKGHAIELEGSDEFKVRVYDEAQKRGIKVRGLRPKVAERRAQQGRTQNGHAPQPEPA